METKERWRDGRRKGANCNSYGKIPSEETREKIRKAQKGIPCPQRGRVGPRLNARKPKSRQCKINMNRSYWIITDSDQNTYKVDILSEWCKEHGFRYDCVRPGFLKKGTYKNFSGYRVLK